MFGLTVWLTFSVGSGMVLGLLGIPLTRIWPRPFLRPTAMAWSVVDLGTLVLAVVVCGSQLWDEWRFAGVAIFLGLGIIVTTWRAKQRATSQPQVQTWIEMAGGTWAFLPGALIAMVARRDWLQAFASAALWALHFGCGLTADALRRKLDHYDLLRIDSARAPKAHTQD